MIATLAALAFLGPVLPSIEDYFPLVPGTKWEYREQGMMAFATYKDEVKDPLEIDGKPAFPIVSVVRGKEASRIYYRIEGDTLYIVAYDAKKPLGSPQPVLKVGPGRIKWTFTGESQFINEPVPLMMTAESGGRAKRDVLGQLTEVLEVKLEGVLGGNAGTAVKSNQVAYYAKGIGLVEMLSDNRVGPTRSKTQLKLVKFEPVAR